MRYLIIALFILNCNLSTFAQKTFIFNDNAPHKAEEKDDIELNMKMLFRCFDNSGRSSLNYPEIKDTVISGCYYINEAKNGFGVSLEDNSLLNNSFFGFPTWENEKYDTALSKRKLNLESLSNKPDFSKILFFEIKNKLLQEGNDSLALFFKYSIYILTAHPDELHYNYDVKLFHKMLIIAPNEIIPLEFLSKHFQDSAVSLVINKTTKNERELYSKFTSRYFYSIYEAAKQSKIEDTVFKLGIEFVRIDRENKNVKLRQLEYPLEDAMILADADTGIPVNLPTRLYKGEFKEIKFAIMNEEKAKQYENDKFAEQFLKSEYDIFILPVQYQDNILSMDVLIEYQKPWGFFPNQIKKRINIKKGEKIKLEIPVLKETYKFSANRKKYVINYYEDHEKYNNEYFIISFEYSESISKGAD